MKNIILILLLFSCKSYKNSNKILYNVYLNKLENIDWDLVSIIKNNTQSIFSNDSEKITMRMDSNIMSLRLNSKEFLMGKFMMHSDTSLILYIPTAMKYDKYFSEFGSEFVVKNLYINKYNVNNLSSVRNFSLNTFEIIKSFSLIKSYKCDDSILIFNGNYRNEKYEIKLYRKNY